MNPSTNLKKNFHRTKDKLVEPLDQHEKELPSIGPRTNSWAHAVAWSDCTVLSGLQNQKACEKEKIYGSDSAGPTKEPLGRSFTMYLPQYAPDRFGLRLAQHGLCVGVPGTANPVEAGALLAAVWLDGVGPQENLGRGHISGRVEE